MEPAHGQAPGAGEAADRPAVPGHHLCVPKAHLPKPGNCLSHGAYVWMIGAMGLCITYSTASDCLHGGSAAVKVKLHLATMH